MVRECAAWVLCLPAGCSWILDFSDQAIPTDAAPYTAAECAYKEPNDTPDTAAPLTPADTGPAAICAGTPADRDYYRITVPGGARLAIRISTIYRPTGDLDLRLYDGTGSAVVAVSHGFSDDEVIACPGSAPTCAALAAGDYVFEVFPGTTGSVNAYTIALAITP